MKPLSQDHCLLFVYGTLKQGFKNHHHLPPKAMRIDKALTKEHFYLFPNANYDYPFLVEESIAGMEKAQILGEVYATTPENLSELDRFEGVPEPYIRKLIAVELLSSEIVVMTHAYLKSSLCKEILLHDQNLTIWTESHPPQPTHRICR